MPKPVDVLVKEIFRDDQGRPTKTGEQITISYKSFLMLNDPDQPRFELLGEVESVDKDGNVKLREGNPNLEAQHRQALRQPSRSVEPVVSTGPTQKELDQQAEIERLRAQLAQQQTPAAPAVERKKPGPKSKKTETEGVAA